MSVAHYFNIHIIFVCVVSCVPCCSCALACAIVPPHLICNLYVRVPCTVRARHSTQRQHACIVTSRAAHPGQQHYQLPAAPANSAESSLEHSERRSTARNELSLSNAEGGGMKSSLLILFSLSAAPDASKIPATQERALALACTRAASRTTSAARKVGQTAPNVFALRTVRQEKSRPGSHSRPGLFSGTGRPKAAASITLRWRASPPARRALASS
jgi:hypothetical protein